MEKSICHDLKTERTGVAPPLPPALAVVPVLFYVGVLACTVLCAKFYLDIRSSQEDEAQWKKVKADEEQTSGMLSLQMKATEKERDRADEVLAWLDGSRSLQPLNVIIARSITEKSSLQSLSLVRKQDDPAQLELSMKLQGDTARQIAATLKALSAYRYRPYDEERSATEEIMDYKAVLIRN